MVSRRSHKPVRFLFVISRYPPSGRGGAEIITRNLARVLARRGHTVTVLTLADGSPACTTEEGVRVLRTLRPKGPGPFWGLTYSMQTAAALIRLAPETDLIVTVILYLHSVVAALLSPLLRIPSAVILMGGAGETGDVAALRAHKGGGLLLRIALRNRAFFALSRAMAHDLHRLGIPKRRILRQTPFVTVPAHATGAEERGHQFVFVGRFQEVKNLPLLLEGFALTLKRHPEATLRLVGEGPLQSELESRAHALGIAHALTIETWTDNVHDLFASALASVITSHREGFAAVIAESLAAGTPVIATPVGCAAEAIRPGLQSGTGNTAFQPGRAGCIVCPHASSLSAAMCHLLENPEETRTMSRAARHRAVRLYSEEPVISNFLRNVRRLTGKESAPE